jgi:plasmid stability protein
VTTLIVRQVDEQLVRSLEERARQHGRSAEAEHRALLEAALGTAPPSIGELIAFFRRGGELGLAEVDLDAAGGGGSVSPLQIADV